MTGEQKIARYYDRDVEGEWARLDRHRTEFAITTRALEEYLPSTGNGDRACTVLDCGGGPGRYSLFLSERGYGVTLLDLSAANLEFAQGKADELSLKIDHYVHASATDLSMFCDAQFDAALLMGPLYHLLQEDDRKQCLAEARRVLRPGGVIVATFICRYAALRDLAKWVPERLVGDRHVMRRLLNEGVVELVEGAGFTDFFSAHPTEIAPMMQTAGFETMALLAQEGLISMIEDRVNRLDGAEWDEWVNLNYKCASDPSLHGGAEHLLYIGRRIE